MLKSEIIALSIFLFIIVSIYFFELIWWVRFFIRKIKNKNSKPKKQPVYIKIIHIIAFIGLCCILYGFFIEPYWLEVTHVKLETSKLKKTSFRIVQISDLHCDKTLRNENKLSKVINPLKPDIIVFTGDSLNSEKVLGIFQKTLKSLKATRGKYAVLGNIDVWMWSHLNLFNDTGFTVLNNKIVQLKKESETITISGMDYDEWIQTPSFLKNYSDRHYHIFLYHTPDLIENIQDYSIDLYLAGHTHGGQVALPFYGALITLSKFGKKYESGQYQVGSTTLYVNRGIGMEGKNDPRVRFLARPEITVIDIYPKKR